MKRYLQLVGATFAMGLILCCSILPAQENWPQWRGARLDSTSSESGLPDALNDETRVWRTELPGSGGASPVVWGEQIFLTTVDGDQLKLMCIGTDGKNQWEQQLDGENRNVRDSGNSASPSPSTDGRHVWATMTDGMVYCFTVEGKLVWKKNLQKEYGTFKIQFGMTSTPILDNGRLYFQLIHGAMRDRSTTSTGWVVALDANTGKEIWSAKRETEAYAENKHSYASPTIFRSASTEFLITHGGDYAIGHSLDDGGEMWRCGGLNPKDSYNPFLRLVSSPVCRDNLIVIPSAKSGPVIGLRPNLSGTIDADSDTQVWRMEVGTPDVATPVIYDGLVYLARESGLLICVDAITGEKCYQQRLVDSKHRSTPVAADGKLYVLGRKGTLAVVACGRESTSARKFDLNEEILASPAISNGCVYVRSANALYCFSKSNAK